MEALYQSVLASDLTVGDEGEDDLISWAKLLEGINAEWELLTEKTTAAVKSLQTE
jgi:hypothetical protein